MNEQDAGKPGKKDPLSRPQHYTTTDLQTTENEVSAGIGGLIRMLQPHVVVETGTHKGNTAEAIALALATNGHGHLYTYEKERRFADDARGRLNKPPNGYVTVHNEASIPGYQHPEPIDVLFLDSSPAARIKELAHYWHKVRKGGIILVHDTSVHRAEINEPILAYCKTHRARHVELHTPRGLLLIEKP